MKHIAILDFGSQYTHLIARTIRELGILAKIYQHNVSVDELGDNVEGMILSGGPQSVFDQKGLCVGNDILGMKVPILGICYGHQFLAHKLGGVVETGKVGEYGMAKLNILKKSSLFEDVPKETQVWMSHSDSVVSVPDGFDIIAKTEDCNVTAMANEKEKIFGLQFHPEVAHSKEGEIMIKNFVVGICKASQDWNVEDFKDELIQKIKKQVGEKKVFILVSGGVDSNVAFALLTKIFGSKRVKGLYIDTGFMRKNESERIVKRFKNLGFDNLEIMNASKLFYERLENIYEPEEKRAIIGKAFLDTKDIVAKKMEFDSDQWLLGQGTIYPDTIESGDTKNSNTIKTHHNRVDVITKMIEEGLIIEPLVDLYKDEVRKLGRLLDLPAKLVDRHPFPGPGLAIRCLCSDGKSDDQIKLCSIDYNLKIFCDKKNISIELATLPIKSVGVQGDNRTYAHPLAIWGENEWEKLVEISSSVTNSNKDVNRVVLLLNKHEKTPSFYNSQNPVFLSENRIELLREIDQIVSDTMREKGIYSEIDQFPVVLIPVYNKVGKESVVLRPINTRDFMTLHFYKMQRDILEEIVNKIESTKKIGYIFFDITNKPPGTTEWE